MCLNCWPVQSRTCSQELQSRSSGRLSRIPPSIQRSCVEDSLMSSDTAAGFPQTRDVLVSASCRIRRAAATPTCINSSGHDPWRLIGCANHQSRCSCARTGSRHSPAAGGQQMSLVIHVRVDILHKWCQYLCGGFSLQWSEDESDMCCAGMKKSAIISQRYPKAPSSVVYAAWRPHSCIYVARWPV